MIREWVVFAGSFAIASVALWPGCVLDFALGLLFQYWAIRPLSRQSRGAVLQAAIKADTFSIIAFEAGMFAWMAVVYFLLFAYPHLDAEHAAYWLMMQIAMTIGLATTYPMQIWLVRRGVKQLIGRPTLRSALAAADG